MTIQNVSQNDTFQIWLSRTNQVINVIDQLTDGTLYVNGSLIFTNASFSLALQSMNVANNLVITSPSGNSLFLQSSNISVNGSVFITGSGNGLYVTNNATISGNITSTGNVNTTQSGAFGNTLLVIANTTTGNLTVNNSITTTTLLVNANTTTGNLVVISNTTTGNITIGNAASIGTNLTVNNNATINGNVTVAGNITVTGNSTFGGTLNVNSTVIASSANITGNINFSGTLIGGTNPALNDIGRNKLHNVVFNVIQRGVGPFTTTGYTADRWIASILGGDSSSITIPQLADSDRAAIGDEEAGANFQVVFTGNNTTGSVTNIGQPIENIRRLSNKIVTVSFWAKAASNTTKLGFDTEQQFGTGGSPSSPVTGIGNTNFQLNTSWNRYSTSFSIPSISGKTLGTNNDNSTVIAFWFSAGSNFNGRSGNIGIQTGTVQLWGIQCEIGSVMTPLEKLDNDLDVAKCKRFYNALIQTQAGTYSPNPGAIVLANDASIPTMRAAPNLTFNNITYTNCGSLASAGSQPNHVKTQITVTNTGFWNVLYDLILSAEL